MKVIIALTLLAVSLRGSDSKSCFDQLPRQNIDPTQLKGTWYLGIHTDDTITSGNVKCIKIEDFSPAENGWELTVTNYQERTSSKTDRIQFLYKQEAGIYELEKSSTQRLTNSQAYQSGVLMRRAKAEDQNMNTYGVGYITNYRDYYIHVSCKNENELLVWAMTPRPRVTAYDVIQIANALRNYGISENLYLGQCDQL